MIEVQGLTKYYDSRPAIVDLTFSAPRGQVMGLLGPRGAGKTTTIRILAGCLGATSGSASVAGWDVVEQSRAARRCTGYLPEAAPLYNEMRVGQYLATMCRLRGVAPRRRRSRTDHVLEACGLVEQRSSMIGGLSSDLRQRVGLAQAVVHDPQVLILDEPTSNLEPAQAPEIRQLVVALAGQRTVILASHNMADVSATCERALILAGGKVVADGAPGHLARRRGAKPGRRVEVVMAGDLGKVERRLRRLAGVAEVGVTSNADGEHYLTVTGEGDDLQDAVARLIVGAGASLRGLNSHSLPVEDVLLQLAAEDGS